MVKKLFLSVPIVIIAGVLLAAAAFSSAVTGGETTAFAANFPEDQIGDGTPENPYIIADYTDLISLSSLIADEQDAHYATAHYSVSADIIYADEMDFLPIGSEEKPFNGVFKGNGVIISGLNVDVTGDNAGLFGYIGAKGSVSGTGLYDATVSASGHNAGGIAGTNYGRISSCFVDATVSALQKVGGIAGYNAGAIENCYSTGRVEAPRGSVALKNAGGLAGELDADGSLKFSYTFVEVGVSENSESCGTVAGVCVSGGVIEKSHALALTNTGADLPIVDSGSSGNALVYNANNIAENSISGIFSNASASNWTRVDVYTTGDGASFAGPVLAEFYSDEVTADSQRDGILFDAFTFKYFAISDFSRYSDWGNAVQPYLIDSAESLNSLSALTSGVNTEETGISAQSFSDKYFALAADVLSAGVIQPIGNASAPFSGNFSGEGHTIGGLLIENGTTDTGLFGYMFGASVSDLYIDEATVSGVEYAGILAGRSVNSTVSDIVITRSSLSAVSNSGGILGMTQNGSLYSVYIQADLIRRGSAELNADVGTVLGSPPQSDGNVWYVGNNVSRTHQYSSMIYMNDPGNDAELIVDASGTHYAFSLSANVAAGAEVEYRTADETTVLKGKVVALNDLAAAQESVKVFYLRFVHNVSILMTAAGSSTSTDFEMRAYFDVEGTPTQISLYDGQTARFVVSGMVTENFSEFRYVSAISCGDSDTQLSLISSENNNIPSLYGTFVMNATLKEITLTVSRLTMPDNYSNSLNKTYDGLPVEYSADKLTNLGNGITAEVRYSSGSNPVNAGSYIVTTYLKGNLGEYTSGLILGALRTNFTVAQCQLSYAPASDNDESRRPVIQWGDEGSVVFSIPAAGNSGVTGFVGGDELTIDAAVTFDAGALLTPGKNKNVNYSLSLSGADASNYRLENNTVSNVDIGEVLKREIYFTPSSTEKIYDGKAPFVSGYGLTGTIGNLYAGGSVYQIPSISPNDLKISFVTPENKSEGDAGTYKLIVTFTEDAGKGKFKGQLSQLGFADVYELYIEKTAHTGIFILGSYGVDYEIKRAMLSVEYALKSQGTEYAEGDTVCYNADVYVPVIKRFANAPEGALTFKPEFLKIYKVTDGTENLMTENPSVSGDYVLRIEGYDAGNAIYENYIFEEYAFTIEKAVPDVAKTAADKEYVYSTDGVEIDLASDVTVTYPGEQDRPVKYFYGSEEIDADKSYTITIDNAGEYDITVIVEGDENRASREYVLRLSVKPRPVTVAAAHVETVYGTEPEYEFTVTDTYGEDIGAPETIDYNDLGISLNADCSSGQALPDVGTYNIILTGDVTASENYEITLISENINALEVKPKEFTVSWKDGMSSVYGAPVNIAYRLKDGEETLSKSPLEGSLTLGSYGDDGIFVPAKLNEYGRFDAGTYAIGWTEEFAAENSNYSLKVDKDSADNNTYSVTKAVFGISVSSAKKTFGETDPAAEWGFVNVFEEEEALLNTAYKITVYRAEEGENAYYLSGSEVSYPAVYAYDVSVALKTGYSVKNYQYGGRSMNRLGQLTIERRAPSIVVEAPSSIEPNVAVSEGLAINAKALDANGKEISGAFSWGENIGLIPDFSSSSEVKVGAVFTPDYSVTDNLNYSGSEFDVDIEILPAQITINWGVTRYVYSGAETPEMTYTATAAGENVVLTLTYDGDRKNVGTYTVTASVDDVKYSLPDDPSVTVEIVPATITVSFGSTSYEIIEGEDFAPTVVYTGFVGGETEEVLTQAAEFDLYEDPGTYELSLSGARADNYEFEYVDSTLIIYRAALEDEESGATFEGAFPDGVTLAITVLDDPDTTANALNKFNIIKGAYASLSDKVLKTVYSLNYSGIDGYENHGKIVVTMAKPEGIDVENAQFVYLTNEGDVAVVENVTYNDDGTVTLELNDAAYIILSVTDESMFGGMTLYIAIGAAVAALLIILIIVTAVKRRRDRKIIKYNDE